MWKDGGEARKKRDNYQRLQKWNQLLTTVTIYFNPPKSSEVAVKVIKKTRMETMRVMDITPK